MSTVDAPGAAESPEPGPGEGATPLEHELWAAIDEIPDPHMPVSLVELGMIYDVQVDAGEAIVEMTYPCMGCPAYGMLQDDIRACLRMFDGVDSVTIDIVWDPVWSKDRLAPDVRRKLNESGIVL